MHLLVPNMYEAVCPSLAGIARRPAWVDERLRLALDRQSMS